jgi:hypothetical protein
MLVHNWPPSLDSYDYLAGQHQSAWAWEFLRRNRHYRAQAEEALQNPTSRSHTKRGLRVTHLLSPQAEANAWALCSFR